MLFPRSGLLGLLLLTTLTHSTPASAQPTPAADPRKPTEAGAIVLADEPLKLTEVGLSIRYPQSARASAMQQGASSTGQIVAEDGSWSVLITVSHPPDPRTSIIDTANSILVDLMNKSPLADPRTGKLSGSRVELIEPLKIDMKNLREPNIQLESCKQPGERFYIADPLEQGRLIRGFTVLKPMPGTIVVFELRAPDGVYTEARRNYELMLATVKFEDTSALHASRTLAVQSAMALLARLGPADYMAVIPQQEKWLRLYRPAASGAPGDAEEIGYRRIQFWKGRRSELQGRGPGKPDANASSGRDDPEGYLVRVAARLLLKQAGKDRVQTVDTEGVFFMTPDRKEEAWSLKTALRDPKLTKPRSVVETGARTGESLTISIVETGKPARTASHDRIGDAYISQFEVHLLPWLLLRSGVETDVAFYAYRSDSETVALRRDVVSHDPKLAGTRTITTRFRDGDEPQISTFRDNGDLISTIMPDGRVWEPTTAESLAKLWKAKGLPLE